jgi:hypothetical protein
MASSVPGNIQASILARRLFGSELTLHPRQDPRISLVFAWSCASTRGAKPDASHMFTLKDLALFPCVLLTFRTAQYSLQQQLPRPAQQPLSVDCLHSETGPKCPTWNGLEQVTRCFGQLV